MASVLLSGRSWGQRMYWQIDTIDIVSGNEQTGLTAHFTDHRTRAEIDEEIDVAILTAITRIVLVRDSHVAVVFHFVEAPPVSLRAAILAAGGSVHGDEQQPAQDPGPVEPFINDAMRALARRLGATADRAHTATRLRALEDTSLADMPAAETPTFVTRLFELAALTSAASPDGSWTITTGYGAVPFVFTVDGGMANIAGKAERFLLRGEAQRPSRVLNAFAPPTEGVACVVLKPRRWHAHLVCARPLYAGAPALLEQMPWIVAATDHPDAYSFAKATGDDADTALLDHHLTQFRELVVNVEVQPLAPGRWRFHGHDLCAEKILDPSFLQELHRQLQASVMLVSIPEHGTLLLANDDDSLGNFSALTAALFTAAIERGEELSPLVFTVVDGSIAGVLSAKPST